MPLALLLLLLLLLSPDSQTAHGHPLYTRLSPGALQGEPGWSEGTTGGGRGIGKVRSREDKGNELISHT